MAKPSFQFYPGDYLGDVPLRDCSCEARGLWVDMLCLMHQGQPYGHLRTPAGDITIKKLAQIAGLSLPRLGACVAELEAHKVFNRTEAGSIYSRRMVKDDALRILRAAGGSQSENNPNVPRSKNTLKDILTPILNGEIKDMHPTEDRRLKTEEALEAEEKTNPQRAREVSLVDPPFGTLESVEDWFEIFWKGFWLGKAKVAALKAFKAKCKTRQMFEKIMVARDAQLPEMNRREPAHRPHAATWLNGERWNDETESPVTAEKPAKENPWNHLDEL